MVGRTAVRHVPFRRTTVSAILLICCMIGILPCTFVRGEWRDTVELEGTMRSGVAAAINKNDIICFAWSEADATGYTMILKTRFFQDGIWGPPLEVHSDALGLGSPALAAGPGGEFYMTFQRAGDLMFTRYDEATGWTEPDIMGGSGVSGLLVCDPRGYLYLFYTEHSTKYHLMCKVYDGTWWAPSFEVFRWSYIYIYSASASPYGGVHMVANPGRQTVVYAFINPDRTFSLIKQSDEKPSITLSADALDRVHVVFSDDARTPPVAGYATFQSRGFTLENSIPLTGDVNYEYERESYLLIAPDHFMGAHIAWMRQFQIGPTIGGTITRTVSPFYEESHEWLPYPDINQPLKMLCNSHGTAHHFYRPTPDFNWENVRHCQKYRTRPGARVDLNDSILQSGDTFKLSVELSNPTPDAISADLLICLQNGDDLLWYPGWSDTLSSTPVSIGPGETQSSEILNFTVPSMTTQLGPFQIYAAMTDPADGVLVGDPSGAGFILEP